MVVILNNIQPCKLVCFNDKIWKVLCVVSSKVGILLISSLINGSPIIRGRICYVGSVFVLYNSSLNHF